MNPAVNHLPENRVSFHVTPPNWTLLSDLERTQLAVAQTELACSPKPNETLGSMVQAPPVDPARVLEATRVEVRAGAGVILPPSSMSSGGGSR